MKHQDVVAHAQALGSLDAASIPLQHWQDFKEKASETGRVGCFGFVESVDLLGFGGVSLFRAVQVVRPMCEWLFHHEVFQSSDGQLPPGGVAVSEREQGPEHLCNPQWVGHFF